MSLLTNNKKFNWLRYFDALWCSHFQLPATYFFLLSGNPKKTRELEVGRFLSCMGFIIELLGVFFLTYGLANFHSMTFLLSGILMKVFGGVLGSVMQNKGGVLWTLELQEKMSALKTHDNEVKAILINHGITESEVSALSTIGSEIYQTELASYQRMRLQNFCFPIACGIGLFLFDEIVFGLFVIFLGLISFPLGEMFYRKHVFRSESEIRAGRSAGLVRYLEKTYFKQMVTNYWVNCLSQVPLLLFVFRFIFGGTGTLLSVFYATTQGLLGLSGTLAFQKTRASSERSVKIAKHLIDTLTSRLFIITPYRWKEHTQIKDPLMDTLLFSSGIVFQNFQTNDSQKLPPLNLSIEAGGGVVVQASSGQGKSQLLLAILHLIEHQGNIFLVKDNHISNVHEYSQEELKKKFFFCKEDNIEKGVRIVDLFRNSFERCFVHLKNNHQKNILVIVESEKFSASVKAPAVE